MSNYKVNDYIEYKNEIRFAFIDLVIESDETLYNSAMVMSNLKTTSEKLIQVFTIKDNVFLPKIYVKNGYVSMEISIMSSTQKMKSSIQTIQMIFHVISTIQMSKVLKMLWCLISMWVTKSYTSPNLKRTRASIPL